MITPRKLNLKNNPNSEDIMVAQKITQRPKRNNSPKQRSKNQNRNIRVNTPSKKVLKVESKSKAMLSSSDKLQTLEFNPESEKFLIFDSK